jgi:alginate O-acetyltransferase complex protein AlgJ
MPDALAAFIHEGRDGWLFLTAGSNNVIGQFSDTPLMKQRLADWKGLLIARSRRCESLGTTYQHLIVPEKLTVYDHLLQGLEIDQRLSPALRLRQSLIWHPLVRRSCLDLVTAFRQRCRDEDLYFRTDSHWSFAGRMVAYRALCQSLGAVPQEDLPERPFVVQQFQGDLGGQLEPPQSEPARFYDLQRDAVRHYASPIVEKREADGAINTLHVGAHVIYRNASPAADPRRLVLFGDSYAHFAPSMLTIMLAETFREVHFVWSTSIDWRYVERTMPDILVTQIAERFMFQVPDDGFDLDAYCAERFGAELGLGT